MKRDLLKQAKGLIFRSGRNCHRYFVCVNGKLRVIETSANDFNSIIAFLFGLLGGGKFALPVLAALLFLTPNALALPTGAESVSGNVQFSQSGNTLTVTTQANRSIAKYQTFNIGNGETVRFNLPSQQSAILNRVTAGNPSQILGNIESNGHVFLVNPSGIFFGANSQVNVGSLTASTLNIRDEDFLAGNYVFQRAGNPASVENHGVITTANGGSIVLMGNSVKNTGTLSAPGGRVHLAVGDKVSMQMDPYVSVVDVTVDEELKQAVDEAQDGITNAGTIQGQTVTLKTRMERSFYQRAVNNTGIIEATHVRRDEQGRIVLSAHTGDVTGSVVNTGKLDASSPEGPGGIVELKADLATNAGEILANGDTTGGTITVEAQDIRLASTSSIQANGKLGGGKVFIGGDYLGGNTPTKFSSTEIATAQTVRTEQGMVIQANATTTGDGGTVIVWSDAFTQFDGLIEAKGGGQGGNGGFVETSSKEVLGVGGLVDASAAQGQAGNWLLDPNNITISSGANANVSEAGGTYDTTNDSAVVNAGSIQTALNAGTSVTIQTGTSGANTQQGNITVAAGTTINKTTGGDATLTLRAHNAIIFDGTSGNEVTITSSSNKLNLVLTADSDNNGSGGISLAHTTLTSNGGDMTLTGDTFALTSSASLNAGSGHISLLNSVNKAVQVAGATDQADTPAAGFFTSLRRSWGG